MGRALSYSKHDCNSSPSVLLSTRLEGVAYRNQRKNNYPIYLCKFLSLSSCGSVFLPSCQYAGIRTVSQAAWQKTDLVPMSHQMNICDRSD